MPVGTHVGSTILKLCISHVCCLIFSLCTYILAQLFLNQTANKKLKLQYEAEIKNLNKTHQRKKKSLVHRNWEIRNTLWALKVSAAYIHLTAVLLGAVIVLCITGPSE